MSGFLGKEKETAFREASLIGSQLPEALVKSGHVASECLQMAPGQEGARTRAWAQTGDVDERERRKKSSSLQTGTRTSQLLS